MGIAAAGIDVGSTTTKLVGVDEKGELVWHWLEDAEPRVELQAERLLARIEAEAGRPLAVVATGYGRSLVRRAARAVTEISCHARGVFRSLGHGGSLVDIGGQDSKVILIGDAGAVVNFAMNDKCAAGTGRFLEVMARRLGYDLPGLGEAALACVDEAAISSTCTVFAESEIIGLIARGIPPEQIARGLFRALFKRVAALARSAGATGPLLLSGGVAHSRAAARFLGEELGHGVRVPPQPQLMGAYGAALVAMDCR